MNDKEKALWYYYLDEIISRRMAKQELLNYMEMLESENIYKLEQEERQKAIDELKKILVEEYLNLWRWMKKRPWIPILYMGTLWVLATLEMLGVI